MCAKIFKASESFTLSLPSMALILLYTLTGPRRGAESQIKWSIQSLVEKQEAALTKAEAQKPADPQLKAVLDKMAAAGVTRPSTVEDVRRAYLFYPKLSGTPEHVFRIEDREIPGPGRNKNIPVRVYAPDSKGGLPVLVFFHGGGFVAGSLDSHDVPLRSLANRCECLVISVGYRLAPENKYPAAPEDAYAAIKWVAEHAVDVGGDSHRIAVGGDGAGGNLAAVVTLMARERSTPRLMFQILIYPSLDFSTIRPSWWAETDAPAVTREAKRDISIAYLPIAANLRDPFIAPVYAKDLKNLPPALLITYEGDNPMRIETDEYVDRLRRDGVVVKVSVYSNVLHGFFLMAGDLDAGKRCIDELAMTLKKAFNDTAGTLP